VLALIVQVLLMAAILMLTYGGIGNLLQLLVWAIIGITGLFLNIFFYALIISVILSWVAPGSHNPGAQLINQITEPALAPFRRLLPNLGGLDLSPIFAFLAIKLLEMLVIGNLVVMSGMPRVLHGLI
jgi:YggT family protein